MSLKDYVNKARARLNEGYQNRLKEMKEAREFNKEVKKQEREAYKEELRSQSVRYGRAKARLESNRRIMDYKDRLKPRKAQDFNLGFGSNSLLGSFGMKPTHSAPIRRKSKSTAKYKYRRYRVKDSDSYEPKKHQRNRNKSKDLFGDNLLGI